MDLTSSQHQHASSLWASLSPPSNVKGANNVVSSKIAFVILGLFNIPAPAAYHTIKYRATSRAIAEWPETFNARWVASFWPDKKPSLLAEHISARVRDALQDFTPMLVLSPLTRRKNRWWTLITANFTHFKLSHLLGNMLALNAIGPACAEVPGMTPLHVFGIAFTASLATGFQALNRLGDTPGWKMCGFSAVACAFTSVAALGAPMAQPDVFGKYPVKAQSIWTVAGMQILSDVISVARAQSGGRGSGPGRSEVVDYMGHLVGYACGAAYYALFLWYQGTTEDYGEVDAVEHEEVPDLPTVMEELRRTRQAAPVRQSEDWEEVANKLGYPASEQGK